MLSCRPHTDVQRLAVHRRTKRPGSTEDSNFTLFLSSFVHNDDPLCSHATTFRGSDAPRVSVVEMTSQQAGTFFCWNEETLLKMGNEIITMGKLHGYRLGIACLSQVRPPD